MDQEALLLLYVANQVVSLSPAVKFSASSMGKKWYKLLFCVEA